MSIIANEKHAILKGHLEELRRMATVVSDSNDAVILHDFDGNILAWNRGAKETYGYTETEALKMNVRDIVAEPDREAALDLICRIKNGEIVKSFELRRITKDGGTLDVWLTTTLLRDETGQPVSIATTERDITERKRAETVLQSKVEELRRMATVVSDSNDAVMLHDFDGKILAWNRGAKETYGYTEAEALKMNARDIVAPEDREALLALIRKIRDGGIVKSFELRRITKDGRTLDVSLTKTLVTDEAGQPVAIATTERDITGRKRAEAEILKLNADLEIKFQELLETQGELVRTEKLAVLGQVSGSVAHELRNPLGVMSNAIYFLQMMLPDASDQTKEYLGIIKSEIGTSQRIVAGLLDSVRTAPPRPEPSHLSQLISQTLAQCNVPAAVVVTLNIPPDLHPLLVDPQQVKQVLTNLVSNAAEAMPDGGTLAISAFANRDAPDITIRVHDTGTGFSPAQQAKLFLPLFTTKARGIGLGLVVVKNLVQANGGQLQVESVPGQGSTFSVLLPCAA
ncbi:MAG: PAS domain S-box protein [Candidatus Eremiobacteraeota bacterium]|nr:PAS domain S-box protein [Candidatus Eremiobacteraeota bacterium]